MSDIQVDLHIEKVRSSILWHKPYMKPVLVDTTNPQTHTSHSVASTHACNVTCSPLHQKPSSCHTRNYRSILSLRSLSCSAKAPSPKLPKTSSTLLPLSALPMLLISSAAAATSISMPYKSVSPTCTGLPLLTSCSESRTNSNR